MMNKLTDELWTWRTPHRKKCSLTTKRLQSKLDSRKECVMGEVEVEGFIT